LLQQPPHNFSSCIVHASKSDKHGTKLADGYVVLSGRRQKQGQPTHINTQHKEADYSDEKI